MFKNLIIIFLIISGTVNSALLHNAIADVNINQVEELLKQGFDVDAKYGDFATSLHKAVALLGDPERFFNCHQIYEIIDLLLKFDADIDIIKNSQEQTVLEFINKNLGNIRFAYPARCLEKLREELSKRHGVEGKKNLKQLKLNLLNYINPDVAEIVMEYIRLDGTKYNKTIKREFEEAVEKGNVELVKKTLAAFPEIIDYKNLKSDEQRPYYPLYEAVSSANIELVKLFLKHKADINAKRWGTGDTPLHRAFEKLFVYSPDLDRIRNQDKSQKFIYQETLEIAKLLILARADLDSIKDTNGFTVREYAKRQKRIHNFEQPLELLTSSTAIIQREVQEYLNDHDIFPEVIIGIITDYIHEPMKDRPQKREV